MTKDYKHMSARNQKRIRGWFWGSVTLLYLMLLVAVIDFISLI